MNRNIIVGVMVALLVAAICIAGCTSSSPSSSNQTASSNGTQSATVNVVALAPVSVSGGQNFSLQLPSDPSTGYRWQCGFDSSVLSLTNQTYVANQTTAAGVVGAGGNDVFTFKAVNANFSTETLITFAYVSPDRTVTNVTVCDVTIM
jgi:inhibitor of cysteine peptidase